MSIHLSHVNLTGATSLLGFSVNSITATPEWSLELMDSGIIRVSKDGAMAFIAPGVWKTAEALDIGGAQGAGRPIDASNIAAVSKVPEALHLDSEGNLVTQERTKEMRRKRKQ